MSGAITRRICNECNDHFFGIVWFEGTFSLEVKEGICTYQEPLRRVANALQKPPKEELKWLTEEANYFLTRC